MGGEKEDGGDVFSLPLTFSNASNNVVCLVGFASTALGFLEDIDYNLEGLSSNRESVWRSGEIRSRTADTSKWVNLLEYLIA